MENLGITGFEPWGGGLAGRVNDIRQALDGRDIHVTAICAGFDGFILAEDPAVKAQFDTTMREIVRAAGELGSTGVIMVPAFNNQKPCRPHTLETRDFLCSELHALGEYAKSCGTTVILEPLNRREAPTCAPSGRRRDRAGRGQRGVKVMGDFAHAGGSVRLRVLFRRHTCACPRGQSELADAGRGREKDNYRDGFQVLRNSATTSIA